MRPNGIFDPFKKEEEEVPKQDFISVFEKEPLDTESNLRHEKPSVTLDGDTYALKFDYADLEIAKERLIKLFYAVNKQHPGVLSQNGIFVSTDTLDSRPDSLQFTNEHGTVQVYIGDDFPGDESTVFRRLAHVLRRLPVKQILDEYHVQVIERR